MIQEDGRTQYDKEENLLTVITDRDIANGIKDEYGVIYSKDGKRLLKSTDNGLETYKIKEHCKVICDSAFSEHKELWAVKIPDSVTEIGSNAFEFCGSLETITIPSSITEIGEEAFCCAGLTILNYDAIDCKGFGFRYIEHGCGRSSYWIGDEFTLERCCSWIDGCWKLKTINIGNNVKVIPDYFIYDRREIINVNISDDAEITEIGLCAFYGCVNLKNINIPSNIIKIGWCAFYGCGGLISVTIPNSVTDIGNCAFVGCGGLTSINVDKSNKNYLSKDGVLFNKTKNKLICYPSGKQDCVYNVPNGIDEIGMYAFFNCSLTDINIPNTISTIGYSAFSNCRHLSYINYIPKYVTIGKHAFSSCVNLDSDIKWILSERYGDDIFVKNYES